MKWKEKILIVMFCIVLAIVISLLLLVAKKTDDYCREIGYDFGHNDIGSLDITCLKYVPHQSGVGEKLVESGKIKINRR